MNQVYVSRLRSLYTVFSGSLLNIIMFYLDPTGDIFFLETTDLTGAKFGMTLLSVIKLINKLKIIFLWFFVEFGCNLIMNYKMAVNTACRVHSHQFRENDSKGLSNTNVSMITPTICQSEIKVNVAMTLL